MTKIGVDGLDQSTTLESNKSLTEKPRTVKAAAEATRAVEKAV